MNIEKLIFTNGLIPVITQDINGNVLMLAYANKEALLKTIDTKKAWYWSRSRKQLWMKGEKSGNTQEIVDIFSDCDNDSLLYVVKQKGFACHKKRYSCFNQVIKNNDSILKEVYNVIQDRKQKKPIGSYVGKIIDDDKKLIGKIREESEELVEAFEKNDNLVWEAADLIFHTLLILANKEFEWEQLENEFKKRRR